MVLAGNGHPPCVQVFDRMVQPVVAEGQFVGFAAHGQAKELVSQTDAEEGYAAYEITDGVDGLGTGFGVARAVGEQHAVGLAGEDGGGRGGGWPDLWLHGVLQEAEQDGAFHTVVDDRDLEGFFRFLGLAQGGFKDRIGRAGSEEVRFLGRDLPGQILSLHGGQGFGLVEEGGLVHIQGADDAVSGALAAQVQGKGAGVHAADTGYPVSYQQGVQGTGRPPVGKGIGRRKEAVENRPASPDKRGLVIVWRNPVIADMGSGKHNNLAVVGWVGQGFLIPGHAGDKNRLAPCLGTGPAGHALKIRAIVQHEKRGFSLFHQSFPSISITRLHKKGFSRSATDMQFWSQPYRPGVQKNTILFSVMITVRLGVVFGCMPDAFREKKGTVPKKVHFSTNISKESTIMSFRMCNPSCHGPDCGDRPKIMAKLSKYYEIIVACVGTLARLLLWPCQASVQITKEFPMPMTPRNTIRVSIANKSFAIPTAAPYVPSDIFGRDVCSMKVMRERLPRAVFARLEKAVSSNRSLHDGDAHVVACAMKDWAIENGATHYTHWFQPMTGVTAEKHDAFLTPDPRQGADGHLINEFSGKMLIKGEPDASSFPSGGIRSTFEARGYTAWDPTSPAFLLENSQGKTLYVPTVFVSFTGESLDRKTPLLRSLSAVSDQASRILKLFGNDNPANINAMIGVEQEYFLIDRRYLALRDDLKLCGRTLFGAKPGKGQELEDHYFGSINARVLGFMAEVERRMLALGIPARTRHNEVAPAQFELAPLYEPCNLATDHNMLTMEILQATAEKFGFACLLHEKPFAGINGSGKHNNWSLCDAEGNNLLDPGNTPMDNAQFLVFLAAVLRAVHKHAILLRLGTIGSGNDHRLGANEAPPAILSIFLGEPLTKIITSIAAGRHGSDCDWESHKLQVGVTSLPPLPMDVSDRNRTSPFAFTGNKFEFRAVGSSMSVAPANIAINTAMACTLDDIATELEGALALGVPLPEAVDSLLSGLFKEHLPIVFDGNGYAQEWQEEAARRGLPNLQDTVSVLAHYNDPAVMEAFMRHGVLSERELLARQEILFEHYIRDIHVETKLVSSMGRALLLPVGMEWMRCMGNLATLALELVGQEQGTLPEKAYYTRVRTHVVALMAALDELDARHEELDNLEGILERAKGARDTLLPLMTACRTHADALELLVDDALWPLPKYNEMLWQ